MKAAKWIWQNDKCNKDEYVHFIDEFEIAGNDNITLNICCDTDYVVYINGALAAFGQYSDFPYHKVYDEIDITRFTKAGKNRIAICGYYMGEGSFTYYPGKAGLIFEICEGERPVCWSDLHTRCRLATDYLNYRQEKITMQLGYGYAYDMSGYDSWIDSDYEYSSFGKAVIIEGMPDKLHKRPVEKLILEELTEGKLIRSGIFSYKGGKTEAERQQKAEIIYRTEAFDGKGLPNGGVYALYDLGREEVGFLYLKIRTKDRVKIGIGYGEHVIDGRVRTNIGNRNFAVEYFSAQGEQEYMNTFRRLGARYLQIFAETDSLEIEKIGIVPTMYPLTLKEYKANNTLRQKIYDLSVRTLRLCIHEHYEDCPWREQSLYTMDSRNQMLCGYYAFEETEMARASLKLFALDNRKDGMLTICAPSKADLVIPSFSLHYITEMYEYILYAGDCTLAEEFFEKLESILNVFLSRMQGGLVPVFEEKYCWNFYEWMETLDGAEDKTGPDLILNSLLSYVLGHMAGICEKLDKKGRQNYYLSFIPEINSAINKSFFDEETGLYRMRAEEKSYSELGNALAILCGAAKGEKAKKIAEKLASEDGSMISSTLSMLSFKYDALILVDREKYKDYILSQIDKNYLYMLECGATSFWETLKGESDFENAGSLCHGWSAIPIYYYHILSRK